MQGGIGEGVSATRTLAMDGPVTRPVLEALLIENTKMGLLWPNT
jgi:hypothetical protein